ncbi:MBL fold metallo-hydrolase [Halobacillus aidingensis]|uniref:Hydroxyacylglutathione hydrolase n=1 Tax=Halobacillus aidingensis TaxID=240303 RepID=A0A1H0TXP6_HALAD|nr:MBL fold metallo-hydrolase [Halobacillus aidingensis]SDP58703.1 hydroxyacylglutathione hydrolase [Halobacillus aidingensis]
MFFKSYFDEELAQMSYMIGCQKTGEAMVVDPARDLSPYYETAKKEGFHLAAAAETHIHADFLSGARELANAEKDLKLYLSDEGDDDWKYQYLNEINHELVKDGDEIYVGNVRLDVIHTPGHTPESLSFLLTDEGGGSSVPMGIFTGDFVFVGDVGRPDLLEKSAGAEGTASKGAADMYQSVQRFKELPDYVQVWPGHGAGSACGKSLGAVPSSTVGYEKENNWALNHTDEKAFTEELLDGQPEPPKYFSMMKKLNKEGPSLEKERDVEGISVSDVGSYMSDEYMVVDTRPSSEFSNGHLKGTINIPYNRSFTNWAGWLIEYDQKIVVVASKETIPAIKRSLESIGLDDLVGYVDESEINGYGGLETYASITAEELENKFRGHEDYVIIDVRNDSEWDDNHIEEAQHIMLGKLKESIKDVPDDKTPIVHCQSGMRSAIAASLLQAFGYKDVLNLKGGFSAWKEHKEKVNS